MTRSQAYAPLAFITNLPATPCFFTERNNERQHNETESIDFVAIEIVATFFFFRHCFSYHFIFPCSLLIAHTFATSSCVEIVQKIFVVSYQMFMVSLCFDFNQHWRKPASQSFGLTATFIVSDKIKTLCRLLLNSYISIYYAIYTQRRWQWSRWQRFYTFRNLISIFISIEIADY